MKLGIIAEELFTIRPNIFAWKSDDKTMSYNINSHINTPSIQCQVQEGAKLPQRAHATDAGADLFAWFEDETQEIEIAPNEQKLVDTGIAVKIPVGYVGLIYNRSSQGKKGITIPHSVGVIDSDYRGNLKVLLKNTSDKAYTITRSDRIAQLVIQPVVLANFHDAWNDTERGTGGFGSTGL
jgi:dUTP pyrophosphatase